MGIGVKSKSKRIARISQWYNEGFRVYGRAIPEFFGQDIFPASLHFDYARGSDVNLISPNQYTKVYQAPFNCKLHNFYGQLNEPNVEYCLYKTDVLCTTPIKVYHKTISGTSSERSIVSDIEIEAGDFLHLFIKRPDASPSYVEARVFFDLIEIF